LHPDAALRERLQGHASPAISFNYLGHFDQVMGSESFFSLATEDSGLAEGLENKPVHHLEVNAMIVREQMHFFFRYNTQLYAEKTVQILADGYLNRLNQLVSITPLTGFKVF